jgi:hypothetical protein
MMPQQNIISVIIPLLILGIMAACIGGYYAEPKNHKYSMVYHDIFLQDGTECIIIGNQSAITCNWRNK